MNTSQGVVKEVLEKKWQNKTLYSLILVDDDNMYGLGEARPQANTGDIVEFQWKPNAKGYPSVTGGSVQVVGKAENMPRAAQPIAGGAKGKDTYWSDKEKRDKENDILRRQGAALNSAINVVSLMLEAKAVSVPQKTAEREEFIWELLNKYQAEIIENGNNAIEFAAQTEGE